jgi:formylglycine-generating enzyme required for sulfatase activity
MKRLVISGLLCAVLALAQERTIIPRGAPGGQRKALVIGNKDYPQQPLANPVNDAADLAASLRASGFAVTLRTNLRREDMDAALASFTAMLSPGDAALVYFSGHGLEVQGQNYLLPVDFSADAEYQVRSRALNAYDVLEALKARGVAVTILILDACRSNPYRGWARSPNPGLAPLQADGAYIAFAAAPGQIASDNPGGRNGLFTKHLKDAIQQPGWTIDDVFNTVRERVLRESTTGQRPFATTGLVGRFYFREATTAPPAFDAAAEAWNEVKDSRSQALLEGYIKEFPDTPYARLARIRLAVIRERQDQPTPQPAAAGPRVNPKDGLTYVYIPPGSFTMGCSPGDTECDADEKPAKRASISKGFYLSESEITQAAFQRVSGGNPSSNKGPELPVEMVTWAEANGYCRQTGGRLPTGAEWEYAGRAGNTAARYGEIDRVAWYSANAGGKTHAVKTKEPNAWGLYDMLGNVREWVTDFVGASRELRSGAFDAYPQYVRMSNRDSLTPDGRNSTVGFRCVWEP